MPQQAYLALHDEEGNYLVARRRITNGWWQGSVQNEALVNQADQWCLPGGKAEPGEDPLETATREFQEETGEQVFQFVREPRVYQNQQEDYSFVDAEIPSAELTDLAWRADANVFRRRDTSLPAQDQTPPNSAQVMDWELQSVTLAPKDRLQSFLGRQNPIDIQATGFEPGTYSQSIDWYAAIAQKIQNPEAGGWR